MNVLKSTINPFDGVVADRKSLPTDSREFQTILSRSLDIWAEQGCRVVWLEIPIGRSHLIPVAVNTGFAFHHSGTDYLMLTYQLVAGSFIPPFATHYIGAGGVVLNDNQELLVVWEKIHRISRRHYYKLPGGMLQPGEHLIDGVKREIYEETGIRTQFESLSCFRHLHGYRFGKSDIYFICRLSPLNHDIHRSEEEIEESLWMPVKSFLAHEHVGIFNKRVVQAAIEGKGVLVPTWIEGYQVDPATSEVFMPSVDSPGL
jgi:8-oxo-dGTP pyrophosphatase MutT (NUDIX family)